MSGTAAVAVRSRHGGAAHALASHFTLDRRVNARDTDLVEFERAWRASLDALREAA